MDNTFLGNVPEEQGSRAKRRSFRFCNRVVPVLCKKGGIAILFSFVIAFGYCVFIGIAMTYNWIIALF